MARKRRPPGDAAAAGELAVIWLLLSVALGAEVIGHVGEGTFSDSDLALEATRQLGGRPSDASESELLRDYLVGFEALAIEARAAGLLGERTVRERLAAALIADVIDRSAAGDTPEQREARYAHLLDTAREGVRVRVRPRRLRKGGSAIVARVGETIIRASELEGAPDARAALEWRVEQELLVQLALRRGYALDRRVEEALIRALLDQRPVAPPEPTEAQVRAYYEAHLERWMVPEMARVAFIFVASVPTRSNLEARALAEEIREQAAAAPDEFAVIARARSEERVFGRRGGDIGYVPRAGRVGIDPRIATMGFLIEPGEVSDVFAVPGGFAIVHVLGRSPEKPYPYETVAPRVRQQLEAELQGEAFRARIEAALGEAEVRIDEAAWQRVLEEL